MPIALTLAAAFFAALATSPVASAPPLIVTVVAANDVPAPLVDLLLQESDAVWRGAGFSFVWRRTSTARPGMLRVIVAREARPPNENDVPLGWIRFDDAVTPEPVLHVSYENALTLLQNSEGVVGRFASMPRAQINVLLGRAMGRALAHELGHYLLRSKVHSPAGLMKAQHSAFELFSIERNRFTIAPAERAVMLAHVTEEHRLASRG